MCYLWLIIRPKIIDIHSLVNCVWLTQEVVENCVWQLFELWSMPLTKHILCKITVWLLAYKCHYKCIQTFSSKEFRIKWTLIKKVKQTTRSLPSWALKRFPNRRRSCIIFPSLNLTNNWRMDGVAHLKKKICINVILLLFIYDISFVLKNNNTFE